MKTVNKIMNFSVWNLVDTMKMNRLNPVINIKYNYFFKPIRTKIGTDTEADTT